MKKASIFLLIVTVVFAAFTAGVLLGRSFSAEPVLISGRPTPTSVPSTVPSQAEPSSTEPTTPASRININTAGLAELETLPGIGPTLAQRILDYRDAHGPFESPAQLANVSGIGEKRLNAILQYIYTGGEYENSGS